MLGQGQWVDNYHLGIGLRIQLLRLGGRYEWQTKAVKRGNCKSDLLATLSSQRLRRETTLATEVQQTSDFIPVKRVPRLHLAVGQRRYTQQAPNKHSVKSSCRVLHKHLPQYQYQLTDRSPFQSSDSGELCSTSLVLIFLGKSFCNC